MKLCFYYWIVDPLRGGIRDFPGRTPAFVVPMERDGRKYEVALLCDENLAPELIRCTIFDLIEEKIPVEALPVLQELKEHMLSTLRAAYRHDTALWPTTASTFNDAEKPYDVNLQITVVGKPAFDAKRAMNLFKASFAMREDVRLLVDGGDPRVPLQYRYLSMYRLLEKHFKSRGKWKSNEFDELLARYENDFKAAGFTGKPAGVVHRLRDKCAHIRVGAKKEEFGVTHLNHAEAVETEKALPVLNKVCSALLSEKAHGTFVVTPTEAPRVISGPIAIAEK